MSTEIELDLAPFIQEFNENKNKLVELSITIANQMETQHPRIRRSHGQPAFENQMWAMALIINGWVGWIFQSKAICHGESESTTIRNIEDMNVLENDIMPNVRKAIEVGRKKAIEDKIREGKLTNQERNYSSLRKFLEDNQGKP